MAVPAEQGGAISSETTQILYQEQMREIIASLSGGTRMSKVNEPEVYLGERHNLQGWRAQLIVYYRTVGWQPRHDEVKILHVTSLLMEDAGT